MSTFVQWFHPFSRAKRTPSHKPRHRERTRLAVENLEDRLVPTLPVTVGFTQALEPPPAWLQSHLSDPGLRAQVVADYQAHNSITRADMLGLFAEVEANGNVTNSEMHDLKLLVANGAFLQMPDYVQNLAGKVVNGDPGNATFQSLNIFWDKGVLVSNLGNLYVGSSPTQLQELVQKWFLGMDYPTTQDHQSQVTHPYLYDATASLFGTGVSYTDVQQGQAGDCYFLAAAATVAKVSPATITSMFIANGDNTYTVRFYNNGVADYVTVDRWLPQSGGTFYFADQGQSLYDAKVSLWVPLLEKAYAQLNHSGWSGGNGSNSYDGIYGGWPGTAVSQITGASDTGEMSFIDQQAFTAAVTSGQLVCLSTQGKGYTENVDGYSVVLNHAYSVLGYDSSKGLFTIYNPWGYGTDLQSLTPLQYLAAIKNNSAYGASVVLQLNWTQISQIFYSWDAGAKPLTPWAGTIKASGISLIHASPSPVAKNLGPVLVRLGATQASNSAAQSSPAATIGLTPQTLEVVPAAQIADRTLDPRKINAAQEKLDPEQLDSVFAQLFSELSPWLEGLRPGH